MVLPESPDAEVHKPWLSITCNEKTEPRQPSWHEGKSIVIPVADSVDRKRYPFHSEGRLNTTIFNITKQGKMKMHFQMLQT